MIRREYGELGDAARGVEADRGRKLLAGRLGGAHETGVAEFVRQVDLEPVRRIVPLDVTVERVGWPIRKRGAEFGLRGGDALRAIDLGEAAGEHRLGFVIQRGD